MGKHTQNCTLIGKGVYGTIGVDQRSRLADGAHFHTMIVTSTLEASVIEGDKLVIKSGIVRCDGDIRVSSISGSGDIEVGGDIICDEITGMRTESWTLGRPDWSPHVFDGGSAQGR